MEKKPNYELHQSVQQTQFTLCIKTQNIIKFMLGNGKTPQNTCNALLRDTAMYRDSQKKQCGSKHRFNGKTISSLPECVENLLCTLMRK